MSADEAEALVSGCALVAVACVVFAVLVGYGVWSLLAVLL